MGEKERFLYNSGLCCLWHEDNTDTVHCSESLVKRWTYTILHFTSDKFETEIIMGSMFLLVLRTKKSRLVMLFGKLKIKGNQSESTVTEKMDFPPVIFDTEISLLPRMRLTP